MLSEIFILRLEAILRASKAVAPGPGHTRFVPIAAPVSPAPSPIRTTLQTGGWPGEQ
jgi:hypothetical protein